MCGIVARMKSTLYLSALLAISCSKSQSAPKLAPLDLSSAGMNATIDAPQGATVKKDSIPGAIEIMATSPEGYAVSVMPFKADLAQEKKDCTDAPKRCEVVSEASDSIVMKRKEFGKDNYVVVVAAGEKLVCQTATLDAKIESRAVADSVLATCHSLKMK